MNGLHRTIRIALLLSSLFAGRQLLAADGEREVAVEINKANGLLRSGDVDGAVKAYQQVQRIAPDRAELSYNMAVAKYRKGDMAAAEQLFNQASAAEDDALSAKARYNLGNCNYATALRLAETDHAAAIKGLEKAIENYRSALEVDPNDADSRANIELAAAMIDKLRDQDKKQQQQKQQQDQKEQQSKDKNEQKPENSKQQESQDKKDSQQQQGKDQQQPQQKQPQKQDSSKEKKSQGEQESQDQKQQKKDDEKSKDKSGDKSEPKTQEQKSQSQESKSDQKDAKAQSQEAKSAAHKPADQSQQRHSQASPTQKPKDRRTSKDESKESEQAKEQQGSAAPKGELTAADKKAGKAEPSAKEMSDKPEVVPEGAMTIQEAEKMLQAIRDQEMIRRMRRQATERNQHVPVDRDW